MRATGPSGVGWRREALGKGIERSSRPPRDPNTPCHGGKPRRLSIYSQKTINLLPSREGEWKAFVAGMPGIVEGIMFEPKKWGLSENMPPEYAELPNLQNTDSQTRML